MNTSIEKIISMATALKSLPGLPNKRKRAGVWEISREGKRYRSVFKSVVGAGNPNSERNKLERQRRRYMMMHNKKQRRSRARSRVRAMVRTTHRRNRTR